MKKILFTALVILLLGLNGFAQNRSSTQSGEQRMILTGVVYDINGAVIVSGTTVIAYNGNGKKYGSVTNDEGIYKIDLPLAAYKIEVAAPGFCPKQVEDFIIVNSTHGKMSLDFVLEVAASHAPSCKQEKIIEEQPKRKTKRKARPIIIASERKLNVRTNG